MSDKSCVVVTMVKGDKIKTAFRFNYESNWRKLIADYTRLPIVDHDHAYVAVFGEDGVLVESFDAAEF